MTQAMLYAVFGIVLFGVGLFGVLAIAHVMKKILAINICGVGVFMVFIANASSGVAADFVPHAMVLTGIVVAVAGTAMALSLVVRINALEQQEEDA
ncbi:MULTISPECIES: NADH-quinone oxidoreductase subunit K [Pseudoalteromonas]|uniref:NADH-ubiquinone oxidoreductase n=2 Tax=Pseudoalteromonas TaxID=53246 RepID=A0A0F4R2H2_9GAMM|nr:MULTISPECIES: NADH-quinone oxidoreductase subunit K [Pseudoalteromonas]KJZ12987.1 NADH-ubiquinone oxidoreductase [Pseudoalteromonas rubra]QTL34648.1 NADH-quinone oxidoreductase subunit K [Pseudoalteromonas viridis]RZM77560.1 Na+/H+ antiporter subunit C [Pseudoalteromonas rubra]